tara:strand:- start:57 stop:308 length:252 start_codon:yes stop_codon:yes gene_type:complete
MDESREVTREEFISLRKIQSLAQQVAEQAVKIADLETQNDLLGRELSSQSQSAQKMAQAQEADEVLEGEEVIQGDSDDTPMSH